MATVRSLITDALLELGSLAQGETLDATVAAWCLRRFQAQIDAWQADRLTLSVQSRTSISWPGGQSTQTVGPNGDIDVQRPVWINTLNYVNPGSSPEVEVTLGPMDQDSYASQSIKSLQAGLPLQYFYQTSLTSVLGSLFLWPQPEDDLTLYLYAPQGVEVPLTLNDDLIGPPGYQEAFMYQLAKRLGPGLGIAVPVETQQMAIESYARMKRPNLQPGLVGVDQALVPTTGGGYNPLTDTQAATGNR